MDRKSIWAIGEEQFLTLIIFWRNKSKTIKINPMDEPLKGSPRWKFDEEMNLRRSDRPVRELWEFTYLACREGQREVARLLRNPILFRGQRHRLSESTKWPLVPRIGRSDSIRYSPERELASIREFQRRAPMLLGNVKQPSSELDWLSLAQHNGMATRLLDWTANAFAALWFAVHEIESPQNDSPVVWALTPAEPFMYRDSEGIPPNTKTWIVCPQHAHARARAQDAWFTVHHFDQSENRFVPLEEQRDYLHHTDANFPSLGRIDIDPDWIPKLRLDLANTGVSAASVFPDIGGLCQDLTEQMSNLCKYTPLGG